MVAWFLGRVVVAAVGVLAAWPSAAGADSIVYEKGGDVWQAEPDGTRQTQITTAGGYSKPTQADDGTIVAVKGKLLQRMDRGGRVLNTAGDDSWTGPLTPALSPGGRHVAYNYLNTGSLSPGFHTALSHSTRKTPPGEIFDISGWSNPSWIGDSRVLMFDGSETFTGDTLIKTLGASDTQRWFEDPELSLSGGEINAAMTRLAATDSTKIRLYKLNALPPAIAVEQRCDLTDPVGSFFRPTWSPAGTALAWQEDDGIWVGSFDIDTCAGSARLVIPGARAPDWGPANVSVPPAGPAPTPASPAADKTRPVVKAKVARRVRQRALLRGLKVKATCNEPCRITADLMLDRQTAKRLRLGARKLVHIGRASKALQAAGTTTMKVRPNAKARRRLARARIGSVRVRVQAVDDAGNRSKSVTRKVAVPGS